MAEIRFKNLPKLLSSMEKKAWIIDSFLFKYKNENYVVILKLYSDTERKPSKYAKAKLEFIRANNTNESIQAYADFYEVHFHSLDEFAKFFKIKRGNANRNLFLDFSEIFSKFIPDEKHEEKQGLIRQLQGSRCEGNNPNAIYCYDVRRNGETDGRKNIRSKANSNKAYTLRKSLYEKYKDDKNLSFFFSDKSEDERTDEEIINQVAARH
jgi:hypothetical protein